MEMPIFDPIFGKSGKFYNRMCMIHKLKCYVMRSFQGQKNLYVYSCEIVSVYGDF